VNSRTYLAGREPSLADHEQSGEVCEQVLGARSQFLDGSEHPLDLPAIPSIFPPSPRWKRTSPRSSRRPLDGSEHPFDLPAIPSMEANILSIFPPSPRWKRTSPRSSRHPLDGREHPLDLPTISSMEANIRSMFTNIPPMFTNIPSMFTNIPSISAPSPRWSRTSPRSPRHPLSAGEQRPNPAFSRIEPRRTPSGRTFGSLPNPGHVVRSAAPTRTSRGPTPTRGRPPLIQVRAWSGAPGATA